MDLPLGQALPPGEALKKMRSLLMGDPKPKSRDAGDQPERPDYPPTQEAEPS